MRPCQYSHSHGSSKASVTRRDFIHGVGLAAAGIVVASCAPKVTSQSQVTSSSGGSAGPVVAIAKANSYEPKLVHDQVQKLLDNIGGLGDVLAHGKRVAIKVNLTGGTSTKPLPGVAEIDSYLTNPEVVKALCQLLRDAGVSQIYIVEACYEPESWPTYGYTDMANSVGATLVDLTYAEPYKDFIDKTPGANPHIYEKFKFNPILEEIDAFISVSKLKCHNTAGVTHTMKNLFGLVPYRFYTMNPGDTYRSGFHGPQEQTPSRLPGVIVDLNHARPINLSLIDGIWTSEAGEGPWIPAMTPRKANVLLAGKNPVATDSVATAVMGFDPTADYPNDPFVHAYNHLNLAVKDGLGTNVISEIKVVGEKIDDVKIQFTPSY
jgi:uncharacterized protein (DUF362 family)